MSDIFLRRIAQQFQQCFVRPQDGLIRTDLLHAFHCVFQNIGQLGFPALQGLLNIFALCFFGLQRARFLLQLRNIAQAFRFGGKVRIALAGNHAGVLRADFQERLAIFFAGEASDGISAAERKIVSLTQFVPELFQPESSFGFSLRPEQTDHFAERDHARIPAVRCRCALSDVPAD